MKILIFTILLIFGLSICAQTANPEALFLTPQQVNRINETQAQINYFEAELRAAKNAQQAVLWQARAELAAPLDKYPELTQIEGKWAFKASPKKEAPTPAENPKP